MAAEIDAAKEEGGGPVDGQPYVELKTYRWADVTLGSPDRLPHSPLASVPMLSLQLLSSACHHSVTESQEVPQEYAANAWSLVDALCAGPS